MANEGLKDALTNLLKDYGGFNYNKYTLDQIKNHVTDVLDKVEVRNSPEKAIIMRFKNHLLKAKDKETILTEITEKMFSL